jgi:type VI secretion system protein ImpK
MNLVPYNESFLISQFHEFYTEVIRQKLVATGRGPVSPNGNGSSNGQGAPVDSVFKVSLAEVEPLGIGGKAKMAASQSLILRASPQNSTDLDYANHLSNQTGISLQVRQALLAVFRRHDMQLLRISGALTESYYDARYIMAAFADEVFIHMDWEGNRTWTSNLLESELFHSHVAGQRFFEKLEVLLNVRNPADRGLAAVYLTALSLGFRGKYQGVNDKGRIRDYRHELFEFVFQHSSNLYDIDKIAFPDAHVPNFAREPKKKLTNPRVWVAVCGLVFLSYLAVSYGVWRILVSSIESEIRSIECELNYGTRCT